MAADEEPDCDYVVVGSGAGGGTVAARLAEAGMRVVLLEAGGDPRQLAEPGLPETYEVPVFHSLASEHPAMRWDFFVRHYADEERQRRDPKSGGYGVLYPRAGALGGCTGHNAMIFVAPHDSDWDGIAALTGDASWNSGNMRRYWQRVENCRYRPGWRLLAGLGVDQTGHGWAGWLDTERALPREAVRDPELLRLVLRSARAVSNSAAHPLRRLIGLLCAEGDPNDRSWGHRSFEGVCFTPLSTAGHERRGARERVVEVAARHPDRLRVELHALASRVTFDDQNRATGVEYLSGPHLYRADPGPSAVSGVPHRIVPQREVILAGGAFNSPQLLMLSGIGPAAELPQQGIPVLVDLAGVGRNLQDRYEVGVVNRLAAPWPFLDGARFEVCDPLYREWRDGRAGMYTSNGAAVGVARRSRPATAEPDLFLMALLAKFRGYYPGYSRDIVEHHDYLTWSVLKAHTVNRAGTVKLRSADPRDTPEINFHYFEEGDDAVGEDLEAVVEGIRFARRLTDAFNQRNPIANEELPGRDIESDAALADYVRDNAWGHHASCTCAIGAREAGGVLGSDFTVHGTRGLRVVDASVFPRIPGFFIASAVYMISEKAADVILADAARNAA
jgi:choline dehydrogenase